MDWLPRDLTVVLMAVPPEWMYCFPQEDMLALIAVPPKISWLPPEEMVALIAVPLWMCCVPLGDMLVGLEKGIII